MSASSLVSVLLACRDGARHLPEALDSLTRQTWTGVEVVAVDDGSRDETPVILEGFASSHPRARVIRTEGVGLAGALARAAALAQGELLARHDADDRSHPERFARQVRFLSKRLDVGVVGTGADVIDEAGARIGTYPVPHVEPKIRRLLRRASPFVHGSVMMRRDVYERAGGYRAPFRAAQDYDLWLRVPESVGLANLPEPLYQWRRHPQAVFARARDEQLFFAALARTLAAERGTAGRDSLARLVLDDPAAVLANDPLAPTLSFYLGEAYVREGRVAEARPLLARAMNAHRLAATSWWLLSFAVGLSARGRRARAGAATASGSAPR